MNANQNYKIEFAKLSKNLHNLEFTKNCRLPRNEKERNQFKKIDNIFNRIGIIVTVSFEKKKGVKFNYTKSTYFDYYIYEFKYLNATTDLLLKSFQETDESGLVWLLIGDHYKGNDFKINLGEVEQLKIFLVRMRAKLNDTKDELNTVKNQITKVVPSERKTDEGKFNEFMRRKRIYKK